jgi:hypothetical protein
MNRQQQAAIVWSRLPDLNFRRSHKTARASRPYELQIAQLSNWTGFEQEVRQGTAPVLGNPIGFVPLVPANEYHIVATESGISARFVENVSQAIGAVFEAQGLNFRFGDSPAGQDVKFTTKPDVIIEDLRAQGRPLVVGELKTPWTRRLDRMPDGQLAQVLGILTLSIVIPRYRC